MFKPDNRILQVGITGGIGSGKSIVCKVFSTFGIPVYDADKRAKEIYIENQALAEELKTAFGKDFYLPDGSVNRPYVSSLIFNNAEKAEQLNNLVHPAVFADYAAWVEQNLNAEYLVKEAALMFESGSYQMMHQVVMVTASPETRISRVLARDPYRSRQQVENIIAAQLPDEEKAMLADYTIMNDAEIALLPQITELHSRFLEIAPNFR